MADKSTAEAVQRGMSGETAAASKQEEEKEEEEEAEAHREEAFEEAAAAGGEAPPPPPRGGEDAAAGEAVAKRAEKREHTRTKEEAQHEAECLEVSHFSMAKSLHKVKLEPIIGAAGNRWIMPRVEHHVDYRAAISRAYNGIVCSIAEIGLVEKAEHWLNAIDPAKGLEASSAALTTFLREAARRGEWAKVDMWLEKLTSPALHPELGELQPDGNTFDCLACTAAERNDITRSDRYMRLTYTFKHKPKRQTFNSVILAFCRAGQPRRGHHWAQTMVSSGCRSQASYEPEVMRAQGRLLRAQRNFQPEEVLKMCFSLAVCLAEYGSPRYADSWLKYAVRCGVKPEEYPEVWEKVRNLSPHVILPTILHAEVGRSGGSPSLPPASPAVRAPAVLSGERVPDAMIAGLMPSATPRSARIGAQDSKGAAGCPSSADTTLSTRASTLELPSPSSARGGRSGVTPRGWSSAFGSAGPRWEPGTCPESSTNPSLRRLLQVKRRTKSAAAAAVALRTECVSRQGAATPQESPGPGTVSRQGSPGPATVSRQGSPGPGTVFRQGSPEGTAVQA